MLRIIAVSYHEYQKPVMDEMKVFFTDFTDNNEEYKKKAGYSKRLVAALQAANFIRNDTTDPGIVTKAGEFITKYNDLPIELAENMKW